MGKISSSGLRPCAIFQEHEEDFRKNADWLRDYYRGYPNRDKITTLLDFWLYAFRCLIIAYGIDAVREFADSGSRSQLRFAYRYEFGVDISLPSPRPRAGWLAPSALSIMQTAYLPGGLVRSISSRIFARLTKFATVGAPIAVQPARRSALLERLVTCFPGEEAETIRSCLRMALPAVFYADPISAFRRGVLMVDCAPAAFMDCCGYENLFLYDRPLNVIGRQHGGGYEMFTEDYWVLYEKRLCDVFVGWGMSAVNERQHRYLKPATNAAVSLLKKRVIVVERPLLPRLMHLMSPPIYEQFNDAGVVEYVSRELKTSGVPYWSLRYPGSLQSPAYSGSRGQLLTPRSGRGESVVTPEDIVIFDILAASLVHYCVEAGITFVVVLSRENVAQFSDGYTEWFEVLRGAGLAFFADEPGALASALTAIVAVEYEMPAAVREFHHRRFIAI